MKQRKKNCNGEKRLTANNGEKSKKIMWELRKCKKGQKYEKKSEELIFRVRRFVCSSTCVFFIAGSQWKNGQSGVEGWRGWEKRGGGEN